MGSGWESGLRGAICYKTLTFNLMTLTLTWAACENTQIQNKLIKFSMSHFMIVYIEINYACYQLPARLLYIITKTSLDKLNFSRYTYCICTSVQTYMSVTVRMNWIWDHVIQLWFLHATWKYQYPSGNWGLFHAMERFIWKTQSWCKYQIIIRLDEVVL